MAIISGATIVFLVLVQQCFYFGEAISVVYDNETSERGQLLEMANDTLILEYPSRDNESELGEFQLLLPSPILDSAGDGGVAWRRYAKVARTKEENKNGFWTHLESPTLLHLPIEQSQSHQKRKHHFMRNHKRRQLQHQNRASQEIRHKRRRRRLT